METEQQLLERMANLGLHETDFEETFVRSGGHGGQNVNKTSTCVMLRHIPTGLQVKCQSTRQQGMNRLIARRMLIDKIQSEREQRAAANRAQVERARRQKRKRSRAAKERILAQKARRSDTKKLRRGSRDLD